MNYDLLKNRKIINILIGDEDIKSTYGLFVNGMPKISGPEIFKLAKRFGCDMDYSLGKLSRWQFYEKLLDYVIENHKLNDFLTYIFSKDNFRDILSELNDIGEMEKFYSDNFWKVIQKINTILYIDGYELSVVSNYKIIYKKRDEEPVIEVENIEEINNEYVHKLYNNALEELNNGNYDSVITKSRTMMEDVLIELISNKGVNPKDNGNLIDLYKQYKELYNMSSDNTADIRIKKLLGGLEIIVQSVSEMRNNYSDSHGSLNRINIDRHHALLVLNSSLTFCEFVINVFKKNK